ncbi:MAG: tetratricopeptide repeat protein [Nocardioidaceae bacterium]|nr:tetratricopeptide repeat protein [Nocardioidaceae bacterium]
MDHEHELARVSGLIDLGRYAEAEERLRTLLVTEPESVRALAMLAETQIRQHRLLSAARFARSAIALEPESAAHQVLLARALVEADRPQAIAVARQAVRLAPSWWQTHHVLACALQDGGRAEKKESVTCAREAVRLAPHVADAHNVLGLSLQAIASPFRARDAYEEALRVDPHHTAAMNNLAILRMQLGNLRGAGTLLTTGLGNAPQEEILRWNHDVLLVRLALRWLAVLAALAIALGILADPEHDLPYWPRPVLLAATLVLGAGTSSLVLRRLPGRSWFHLGAVLERADRSRRAVFGTWAAMLLTTTVMGLAPRPVAWAVANVLLLLVGLLILAGWTAGLVRLLTGSSGSDR